MEIGIGTKDNDSVMSCFVMWCDVLLDIRCRCGLQWLVCTYVLRTSCTRYTYVALLLFIYVIYWNWRLYILVLTFIGISIGNAASASTWILDKTNMRIEKNWRCWRMNQFLLYLIRCLLWIQVILSDLLSELLGLQFRMTPYRWHAYPNKLRQLLVQLEFWIKLFRKENVKYPLVYQQTKERGWGGWS